MKNEKVKQAGEIELTPKWVGVLPYLIAGIDQGKGEGRKIAKEELQRMAQAADKWNSAAPMLREAADYLQSIADSPDHIDSEGVAALLARMKGLA